MTNRLLPPLFYGTSEDAPEVVFERGLLAGGPNTQLLDHAMGSADSAFRTAFLSPSERAVLSGAVLRAGEGGWVYRLVDTESWDLDALLAEWPRPGDGQGERAILANVPAHRVEGAYPVKAEYELGPFVPNPRAGRPS